MTIFFPTATDFNKWLETNHAKETELWVGYYKKATGIPSMTWSESGVMFTGACNNAIAW